MELRWLVLLAACSNKPHAIEDARSAQPTPRDAPAPYRVEPPAAKGDVQIRVEWHDVPLVARASPGMTACNTPRAAAVAPTTTWGIPDAVVMVDVERGAAPIDAHARIVLEHCALAPRVVLAGSSVDIASAADAPATVTLQPSATVRPLGGPAVATAAQLARAIQLPVIGHSVRAPVEAGTIYRLAAGDEVATIVVPTTPYVAITEATGQVVLRDVPTGTYPVIAWLPARGGQPARGGHGSVTVTAGALAEVTVELSAP